MKRFLSAVLIGVLAAFSGQNLAWADPAADFESAKSFLSSNYALVGSWVNGQLAKSASFFGGGFPNRPADVKSFPGFEIGVTGAMALSLDPDGIKGLPTYGMKSNFLDFPAFFIIPGDSLHAKIGLIEVPGLGKLDLGGSFGSLQGGINEFSCKVDNWKLEARLAIAPVPMPLDLSLNLGVGNVKGSYSISRNYREVTPGIQYNGNTYEQTVDSVVFLNSDWDISALFAKLVISKNLIFLTPFAGIGVQKSSGTINSVVGSTGRLELDPSLPGPVESQNLTIQGKSQSHPRDLDYRLLGGIQFNLFPFMSWGIAGEWGQGVYGLSTGLTVGL